jgi:hypothetical protein
MRIGIITISEHNNYGNRLQNYALQRFLLNYADNVDTIWWCKDNYLLNKKFSIKTAIKYLLNYKETRLYINNKYIKDCIREYNIKKFSDKYISIKYDYTINKDLSNKYDFFIVGSDQVWNTNFWMGWDSLVNTINAVFLKFLSKEKRVAYAASIAIPEIPKDKEKIFKDGLNEMKAISVREKTGADLVKNLTGREVPVVVDPTILLSKEEWQKIEMVPEWYNGEKYILTYFLGNPSPIIKNIAKKNNWKIYNLMDKDNFDLYTSRVEEFVYLINHAQLVVTDSFHASVFSILMNTSFLVVNRQQKGVADMTSRIDTLMELFGYQDRYIVNGKCDLSDEEILYMDFSNVKSIQEREIERSTEYMKEALNIN